jgi:hypothetical protein
MKVEVKDNSIVITLPLQGAALSKSGKTYTVATTNGFKESTAEVEGKKVSVSVNAFIKK